MPALARLVKDQFGMLFNSSSELAQQIKTVLDGFDATDETGGT